MKNITKLKLHSLHIALGLLFLVVLGSIGVGVLVQSNSLLLGIDSYFYELIHNGPNFPLLDFLIKPFNYNFLPKELSPGRMPSYYYLMILFTIIYLAIFKRTLVLWAVLCFILGTFLAIQITALDWHFVFRTRPFLLYPSEVDQIGRSAWQNLSSYPSGHARETALYATIMAAFIPRTKWFLLIFVLFIMYSRIYIGAHFPSDVIAGALIGYLTAKVTLLISREIQIIVQKKLGGTHSDKPKETK